MCAPPTGNVETIVITPTDDFIGQLKATNRQIVTIIVALTALELFLICDSDVRSWHLADMRTGLQMLGSDSGSGPPRSRR